MSVVVEHRICSKQDWRSTASCSPRALSAPAILTTLHDSVTHNAQSKESQKRNRFYAVQTLKRLDCIESIMFLWFFDLCIVCHRIVERVHDRRCWQRVATTWMQCPFSPVGSRFDVRRQRIWHGQKRVHQNHARTMWLRKNRHRISQV